KLCRKAIEKIYPAAKITEFTRAQDGLDHIISTYTNTAPGPAKAILLLDIMMPIMNAWDFLDAFDKLGDHIKNQISIYILSSSVSKADMARAQSNKYVEYYLIKPLTKESLKLIVHVQNKRLNA
ncbi:MAG TPA: hypothetical protein VEV15_00330, partial [Flavisolibacter sp.]|nr:hypothetical protein [Flavisolibacter sp.]